MAGELGLHGTHTRPNGWRTEPDWTDNWIATLRRDYGKVPTPQLAANLDRNKGGVFSKAWSLGLVHGYIRKFTEDERAAICIAHAAGISLTDLSAALDRDPAVVSKHAIRHLGLSFHDRVNKAPRGRRRLRPRLTLADILALNARAADRRRDPARPPPAFMATSATIPEIPPAALIAGPGAPAASSLAAMLAAGLLTTAGTGAFRLLTPSAHAAA